MDAAGRRRDRNMVPAAFVWFLCLDTWHLCRAPMTMACCFSFRRTVTLRTVILLVAVASICFGALAWKINTFRAQEAAVESLAARRWAQFAWEPAEPAWFWSRLERWTGVRYAFVVAVQISSGRCNLEDAACWRQMPMIRRLEIHSGVTGDDVVEQIAELSHLESLRLHINLMAEGPDVIPEAPSNRSVRQLARLKQLRYLDIQSGLRRRPDRSWIFLLDDEGLKPIFSVAAIESLNVPATGISIEGLRPLLARGSLREVRLPRSFEHHVDELLRCSSLRLISIDRIAPGLRERDPTRLFDADPLGDRETSRSGLSFGPAYDYEYAHEPPFPHRAP